MTSPTHRGARAAVRVASAVAALALVAGCDAGNAAATPPPPQSATPAATGPATVRVDTATVDAPLVLAGQLYVERDAVVAARAAGMVDAVLVDLGSAVQRGQALATLDRAGQEIAVARAVLARESAARALDRARELRRHGAIAPIELEDAELRDRASALALREAQHALSLTQIPAPFAGRVTARYVGPGRLVAVGDTLFRVTESGRLLVRVHVPETAAAGLAIGASAVVMGADGAPAPARVTLLAPVVDAASGTREVVLALASHARLLPGAAVRVRLDDGHRRQVVVVPRAAVDAEGHALVLDAGRPVLRAVTLGADAGDGRAEVLGGLAPGDRVVLRP
jgi:RND family efflux transporter MFP subunit